MQNISFVQCIYYLCECRTFKYFVRHKVFHAVILVKLMASAATKSMHPWSLFSTSHAHTFPYFSKHSRTLQSGGIVCSYTLCTHHLGGWWASMIADLAQTVILLIVRSYTGLRFPCIWSFIRRFKAFNPGLLTFLQHLHCAKTL